VVTATVDIVQYYCVLCGVYCGYRNSRYSAMILCSLSRLLWLQQQYVYIAMLLFFFCRLFWLQHQ